MNNDLWLNEVRWNDDGLVPVITQSATSNRVLMLAWMNKESLQLTVANGYAVYWSRSRQRLWHKGEESGHRQKIIAIQLDCDGDTILLKVTQIGDIACHTGRQSCFYRRLIKGQWQIKEAILKDPKSIYSTH